MVLEVEFTIGVTGSPRAETASVGTTLHVPVPALMSKQKFTGIHGSGKCRLMRFVSKRQAVIPAIVDVLLRCPVCSIAIRVELVFRSRNKFEIVEGVYFLNRC